MNGASMYRQEGTPACTLGQADCYWYFGGTLAFTIAVYLFETYLQLRQHSNFSLTSIPKELTNILTVIDKETASKPKQESKEDKQTEGEGEGEEEEEEFDTLLEKTNSKFIKSQDYGRDKSTFGFVNDGFDTSVGLVLLCYGFMPYMGISKEDEIYQSLIFFIIYTVIESVMGLPWSLYFTFVIEERHGFNKQTLSLFFSDQAKSLLLMGAIGLPFTALVIWVVKWGGEKFVWYVWGVFFVFQVVMMTAYPVYIAPLFNKYEPLPEGKLREEIEALAKTLKFPLTKLFVMDGSKRSSHSNAFMYGFFNNKRIVLFDTLIDHCTIEEVVGILGHEMGHWKMYHTVQGFVIAQAYVLAMFCTFSYIMHTTALFNAFGFNSKPVAIGFILFSQTVWAPVDKILSFVLTWNTRRNEFQADDFAVNLGYTSSLQSGLTKISLKSLGNMVPDSWYSTYHYSHPPLVERLVNMQEKGRLVARKSKAE